MNWFESSLQVFEWIGTIAFALAGAMVAVEKRTDLFGVIFLAITTAMGGGIVRDILLGYFPARFFTNDTCLLLSLFSALVIFLTARCCRNYYRKNKIIVEKINQVFDALGLGAFAVSGTQMGIEAGYGDNAVFVIFLGMTTAVGGGIIRDLLLGEIPFVLRKHIYAVAAISGSCICYLIYCSELSLLTGMAVGLTLTFLLRMCAIRFEWNLPKAF
ncbi:MAG: trimeric intracellular cation channel family protein [Lachnospiraceae bacterium]|nr:trimeric intracellular cation channel family protein [Lachnospiraceae bacterium]